MKHLEIGVEESEGSNWVELLNSLNEAVTLEGPGTLVSLLDPKTRPSVEGLDQRHTGRVETLVADGNRLKAKIKEKIKITHDMYKA